jgi:cobalt-zinc-cadmium efflux system protein
MAPGEQHPHRHAEGPPCDHDHGHDHGEGHGHHHGLPRARLGDSAERRARDRRRLTIALMVTGSLFVAELVGGLYAHSLALVSDAGHMLSDLFAQVVALAAIMLASRPADARRTFGWHRVEILAALGNGILLGLLSGTLVWQAWHRFGSPVQIHTQVMMIIAAAGLVANLVGAWLLRGAESLNVRGAYLHVLSDTISSVAVLVGGAVMFAMNGAYWLDPALSILIGIFVMWGAIRLIFDAVDILLNTVPRELDRDLVAKAMGAVDGVVAIHELHIWSITSGLHSLSAHVVVRGEVGERHDELLRRLHEVLQREFQIEHTTLQLEPVGFDHIGPIC